MCWMMQGEHHLAIPALSSIRHAQISSPDLRVPDRSFYGPGGVCFLRCVSQRTISTTSRMGSTSGSTTITNQSRTVAKLWIIVTSVVDAWVVVFSGFQIGSGVGVGTGVGVRVGVGVAGGAS